VIVARVCTDDCRHRAQAGEARGAPPPFAGDELVTVRAPPHQQRLQNSVLPDRFRQLAQRLGIKSRAHLLMRRAYLINVDICGTIASPSRDMV